MTGVLTCKELLCVGHKERRLSLADAANSAALTVFTAGSRGLALKYIAKNCFVRSTTKESAKKKKKKRNGRYLEVCDF